MTDTAPATIYKYDDWQGGAGDFLTAMHSGQVFECDEDMYYYWLEVLPPSYLKNPVTLPDGQQVRSDFGFAEGAEPITAFWKTKDRKDGAEADGVRFFGCRTKIMNRD